MTSFASSSTPHLEIRMFDQLQEILCKRYKFMLAITVMIIVLGVAAIPLVTQLNPAHYYTRAVRLVFTSLALASAVFSLVFIGGGLYLASYHKKEMMPVMSSDSHRDEEVSQESLPEPHDFGRIGKILEGHIPMSIIYIFASVESLSYLVCLGHTVQAIGKNSPANFLLIAFILLLLLSLVLLLTTVFYMRMTEKLQVAGLSLYEQWVVSKMRPFPF